MPSPNPQTINLNEIGQISISVTDIDKAVNFYRDILGIPFLFQISDPQPMAFFNCNGIRLYINQPENPQHSGTSVIYFKVDSTHQTVAKLKTHNIKIESEPHIIHQTDNYTLWMAFFKDPDDNLMAVMSEEGDLMG